MDKYEEFRLKKEVEAYERYYLRNIWHLAGYMECPVWDNTISSEGVLVVEGDVDREKMYANGWVLIEQDEDISRFMRESELKDLLDEYSLGDFMIDNHLFWEMTQLMMEPTTYVVQWWKGKIKCEM